MDFRKKYRLFLSGILILCLAGLGVLNYIQIRDRIPDSYIQTEGEARPGPGKSSGDRRSKSGYGRGFR